MDSRMELDDFIRNNSIKKTIPADVTYLRDNVPTRFSSMEVHFTSDSYGPGIVSLDELDTTDYYTEFNTDYQVFVNKGNSLVISGKGNGEKSFRDYKVTITL